MFNRQAARPSKLGIQATTGEHSMPGQWKPVGEQKGHKSVPFCTREWTVKLAQDRCWRIARFPVVSSCP
jgi:hypothetical protein